MPRQLLQRNQTAFGVVTLGLWLIRALAGTQIADSVIDLFGGTPLVRMKRIMEVEQLPAVLAMKMETTNPGGSSKDRPALEMILAAERDGLLKPGGTIVEPTSGNTGVGLAIVAAQRGYKCVFVMTDKVAPEKIALLKAYGAEVVVCPVAVRPMTRAQLLQRRRAAHRRDATPSVPNQYANPQQPARPLQDHRPRVVGPDGRPDHPFRRRRRHVWVDHGHRPVPEGAEPGHQDHRRRPGGLSVLRRVRPALSRRRRR